MEREQVDAISREFAIRSRDIREDISKAALGSPWLSWFPIAEFPYGEGFSGHIIVGDSSGDSKSHTYELKRALVKSNPIDLRYHDTSEPDWQISKFRSKVLYTWERFIRGSYLGAARIGGPDPFGPKYDIHPVAVSRPITPDVLKRAVDYLTDRGAARLNDGNFGLVSDISVPSVDGLSVLTDSRPRRFRHANHTIEEVPPYLDTDDCELVANPEYAEAPIQDYPIITDGVMELLVPKPLSDSVFDPGLWTGRVHWVDARDQHTNPYGYVGRYISALEAAVRPLKIETSYVIRALRP